MPGGMPLACRDCIPSISPQSCGVANLSPRSLLSRSPRTPAPRVSAEATSQDLVASRRLVCVAPLFSLGAFALGFSSPPVSEAAGIPEVLSQGLKKQLGQCKDCDLAVFVKHQMPIAQRVMLTCGCSMRTVSCSACALISDL